jgi:signal peptidase I
MSRPKSIFHTLSVRAKWMDRGLRRSILGQTAGKLGQAWNRFLRWWSIYRLRYSWARFMSELGSVTCVLGLATMNYWIVSHFVFESVQVQGSSMYPTLLNADFYWINKLAYELRSPKVGDIVALKDPSGHGFDVKRIIATPEQSIYISHGKVYVDGNLLHEPYLPMKLRTYAYDYKSEDEFFCVGRDQFFVMGDNRGNSCDSRTFGPISREAILGKIVQ